MKPHEALQKIRDEGWGFQMPGERSLYWNPRGKVPQGHLEIFTISRGRLTWYLVPVSDEVLEEARRIRQARQAALEDLRYPEEWT